MFHKKPSLRYLLYKITLSRLITGIGKCLTFDEAIPGAAIAVHTFGDFQQFNPAQHPV
jgi:hypothetical protein